MEDHQSLSVIREYARQQLTQNRRLQRDEASNLKRRIQSSGKAHNNVETIVNKLKTKSSISSSELKMLKNSLVEDKSIIELILNTHGALRGIVRELTGHNVPNQWEAADCLNNMGLGDSRAGAVVAKAAGTYLTAQLDNVTAQQAVNCAYALGTLASSGVKVAELLCDQGAMTSLTRLTLSGQKEMQDAALYAVTHFVFRMGDQLSTEHLTQILQTVSKLEMTLATQKIIFALSCHKDFILENQDNITRVLLQELVVSIEEHLSICMGNVVCCKLVYSLRILANLNLNDSNLRLITSCFVENKLKDVFHRLLSSNNVYVRDGLLWLLGNIYNRSKMCGDGYFDAFWR